MALHLPAVTLPATIVMVTLMVRVGWWIAAFALAGLVRSPPR